MIGVMFVVKTRGAAGTSYHLSNSGSEKLNCSLLFCFPDKDLDALA